MAGENSTSDTLSGLFKKVYGELENLMPNNVKLTKSIDFVKKSNRIGESFNNAVIVKSEHGVSYGGTGGDVINYATAAAGATKQITIQSAAMYLRSAIPFEAISRSENLDAAAFAGATGHVIKNMLQSAYGKYEQQCFYGGVGLATVGSVNTSTKVITITTSEWAPGIWVGAEGMKLEAYATGSSTKRTGTMVVEGVDIVNRTITVDALATGLVATDDIFEFGAKGKEFIGVHKMVSATTGSIFGLSVEDYSLWRGNTYSADSAALTFKKISKSIAAAVAKGVSDKLTLFVNPSTWSDLLTEQTAQRIFHEGGMSEYTNGSKSIMFYSQNGDIEIVSSAYVKEGYAYALDLSSFMRVGSRDLTFEHPLKQGKFIEALEGSNAAQIICYCDSSLFCTALGRNIIINNITNS